MLCELCKINDATVHFKQISDGEVREMDICPDCAEKNGFEIQSPLAMTDFLFGIGTAKEAEAAPKPERSCPVCHMRPSDFKKSARLGCARCYETFAGQLEPMLREMHRHAQHVGKVLTKEKINMDLKRLGTELERAVARQDFEQAAILRDRIRSLKEEGALSTAAAV